MRQRHVAIGSVMAPVRSRPSRRRLPYLTAAAVLLATPMPVVAQDGLAFGWAMERLELELDLDHERGSLEGHASYHLRNESGEPISEVSFNLGRLMTVRAVRDADGQSLPFMQDVVLFADDARRQVNHILVALPEARAPGEVVELRLEYGGYLVGYRETGSVYIQDRVVWNAVVRYLDDGRFSILRTDAFAWPVPGTLNAGANRAAPRPDFSYRAAITVPDSFIVATGGALVERTTWEGRTTFVYESTAPVPFLNLPIAEYVERSSDGIRVYYFRADSIGGQRVLDRTVAGLDLLAEWFGPLRSTPELAVMEIPEMWGSQASLTAGVILTADAFSETGSLVPLYHELTHLWNPRDVDLPSARWNEGLATFLQLRMAQDLDSFDAMEGTIRRFADGIVASGDRTPDITTVPFARYGAAGRTDLSYRVGALMFHALYSNMGSDAFDAAFREYYQMHRDDGGTFDGLLEAFQAHSAVDLSGFFDTWVRTTAWYDQLAAGTPHERVGIQEGR